MTILICAFLVAAGAAFIVYRLVGREMGDKLRHKPVKVTVAARDLEIGTLIKATDLTTGELVGDVPKDVVLTSEAAIGRGVVSTLYAGEPLMEKRLAAVGSGAGLAAIIPTGMRACAVKVDQVVGVAGFVLPGMRVDVIISGNDTPNEVNVTGMKTKTLLQNLEVLSAGTNIQKDNEGKPVQVQVVNLLVNPEQAELLSLASNETKIQLVLRNPLDTKLATPPGTQMAGLFSGVTPKPNQAVVHRIASVRVPTATLPPAPAAWVVKVMNGSKESKETFQDAGN